MSLSNWKHSVPSPLFSEKVQLKYVLEDLLALKSDECKGY